MVQNPGNLIVPSRGSLLDGLRLHRAGAGLLWRNRRLWGLAAVPFVFSFLAFCATAGLVASYGDVLYGWTSGWLPQIAVATWYAWIWLGPLKFVIWVFGGLLFLGVVALCFFLGFLIANIFASPFFDLLSERVERLEKGKAALESGGQSLWQEVRGLGHVMFEELRRVVFFILIQLVIVIVGLIPGGQIVALPASFLAAALFLTLDMSSYALDRRRLSFAKKREWLSEHKFAVIGYGAVALLACALPGLNWFAMPWFVTSGTLMVLRFPPEGESIPETT